MDIKTFPPSSSLEQLWTRVLTDMKRGAVLSELASPTGLEDLQFIFGQNFAASVGMIYMAEFCVAIGQAKDDRQRKPLIALFQTLARRAYAGDNLRSLQLDDNHAELVGNLLPYLGFKSADDEYSRNKKLAINGIVEFLNGLVRDNVAPVALPYDLAKEARDIEAEATAGAARRPKSKGKAATAGTTAPAPAPGNTSVS